jgi:hypothetical protein
MWFNSYRLSCFEAPRLEMILESGVNRIFLFFLIVCRRTAPLTSKRFILNIYSTIIRTEYFKHAA